MPDYTEERFTLRIMPGLRPDAHAMHAPGVRYVALQVRLDSGRAAILQLVDKVGSIPIDSGKSPRTLLDEELIHEVRLSTENSYEAILLDALIVNTGTDQVTMILHGAVGTVVSVRVISEDAGGGES